MKKVAVAFSVLAFPLLAGAQAGVDSSYLSSVVTLVRQILGWAVPILIGLAFVWFLWNVFAYMIKTDPEGKEGARKQMIYGIIGLAIMIAVWGLVNIVTNFFGVEGAKMPSVPTIPNL